MIDLPWFALTMSHFMTISRHFMPFQMWGFCFISTFMRYVQDLGHGGAFWLGQSRQLRPYQAPRALTDCGKNDLLWCSWWSTLLLVDLPWFKMIIIFGTMILSHMMVLDDHHKWTRTLYSEKAWVLYRLLNVSMPAVVRGLLQVSWALELYTQRQLNRLIVVI